MSVENGRKRSAQRILNCGNAGRKFNSLLNIERLFISTMKGVVLEKDGKQIYDLFGRKMEI